MMASRTAPIARSDVMIIAFVLAVAGAVFAGRAVPLVHAESQAESERPRVRALVQSVVAGELAARNVAGSFTAIGFGKDLPGQDGIVAAGAVADYAVEARQVSDHVFRVQAWPRPDALKSGRASAVSYFVDLSLNGKVVDEGWAGEEPARD